MAKKVLNWVNLETEFSNKKTAAAYKAFRAALDSMKEAQGNFDGMLAVDIAKAQGVDAEHVVVSHRFGLAYAIDPTAKKSGTRGKVKV